MRDRKNEILGKYSQIADSYYQMEDVQEAMDEYANLAIDEAILVAKEYREMKSKHPNDSSEYNFTNLISRLESLKNITQW